MTAYRSVSSAAGIFLAALFFSGCSAPPEEPEAPAPNAYWSLLDSAAPVPGATSLQLGVVRSGCSGGLTGKVLDSRVDYAAQRVTITIWVEQQPDGAYSCPSNETVPYTLELREPLGERELVDGACADPGALGTVVCSEGGLRWEP